MSDKFISEKRIEELSQRPWGQMFPKKIENLKKGICTTCKAEIVGFKNAISLKEYNISGMCQKCQDSVFGGF